MAETDHVHERPEVAWGRGADWGWCKYCGLQRIRTWWDGHEQAITDVQADGLPDHRKRVARVVALAAARSLLHEEWMTVEEVIDAYHAWTKEPA